MNKKRIVIAIVGSLQLVGFVFSVWAQPQTDQVSTTGTTQAAAESEESEALVDQPPQAYNSNRAINAAPRNIRELDATIQGVLDSLVKQGVLSDEQVQKIVDTANHQASQPNVVEEAEPTASEKIIRVPYVTENVKNQIRDEVRAGLREDTIAGVLSQAKQERWGMPGVSPEWVGRIKLKGDLRLRAQLDNFADNNELFAYRDYNKINEKGSVSAAGIDARINTTEDRTRLRIRARLGMDAVITPKLKTVVRLATGGTSDPVSTNQTLGNSFNRFSVSWDQAYIRYDDVDRNGFPKMTLVGGRMPNPFFTSDLLFDDDLNLDGIAGTYRFNMRGSEDLMDITEHDRTLFMTAGAFPLQEVEKSNNDKWLYGGQVGFEFIAGNQSIFTASASYFDYENIVGEFNATVNGTDRNYTAPQYFQKGNTAFDIANSIGGTTNRYALASDFSIAALAFAIDFSHFAPHHIVFNLDFVENLAFDAAEVESRVGTAVEEKTSGYQVGVTVGWPHVNYPRRWRVQLMYKRLERDAVVDAFTDSDFHLGGTDAKGYALKAEYGLTEQTWVTARYLSTDEVDNEPFAVDTLQVDISTKF